MSVQRPFDRRRFLAALGVAGTSISTFSGTTVAGTTVAGTTPDAGRNAESHDGPGHDEIKRPKPAVQPFPMSAVRLSEGPMLRAQEANRAVLRRMPEDRLLHTFLINAGLPSSAEPLGGWEKPDCELRGHFTGHFLSACAQLYAATGDAAVKAKADEIVNQLAKCQQALGGGYLSAFPLEYFDRLQNGGKVWAPFYTIHKIMAGLLDMYVLAGNKQALEVVIGMADWTDKWTKQFTYTHMQQILNTEFGGMGEVLLNLYAVTGEKRYLETADRFNKGVFLDPLLAHRDQLKGLHVNTHVPQVIAACRHYEMTGDPRYRQIGLFFYETVTESRRYVTGGTSNNEGWLTEAGKLAAEWKQATDTAECCCVYNMLKLARHLYEWSGDPRYFDYYERTLLNHRLGTIDLETGNTMYYLSHTPGAWKTFCSEYDSFWCCTGTGVEEYSKLNNSIYFFDQDGLYVNLFVASELTWKEKGLKIAQQTQYPMQNHTTLTFQVEQPVETTVRLRIPWWADEKASAKVNGVKLDAMSSPGSYLVIHRTWKTGDTLTLELPMGLHVESMPDDPTIQAVMYGPLVLAANLGEETDLKKVFGPMGPDMKGLPMSAPVVKSAGSGPVDWVEQVDSKTLAFQTKGQAATTKLTPLNQVTRGQYSIYWKVV
jgi:uncharacterized protein